MSYLEDFSEMSTITKLEALQEMTDGDVEVHLEKLEIHNAFHPPRRLTSGERDFMRELVNHLREYAKHRNVKKRYQ
jgi:hypothetical protein